MAYQDVFTALADPTRRRLFETLCAGPMTVSQLAEGQPVSRPAVSQHLKVLEAAQLVSAVARGNRRFYGIRGDGLEVLRRYLDGLWSTVRSAYGAEIARRLKQH